MGSNADSLLTDDFKDKLTEALVAVFEFEPSLLRPELPLGEVEGWDSMNAVNFTLELETAFGVELAGVILTADQTIADVVALLREHGAS